MMSSFQHDYYARNDPKLQYLMVEHGVLGIGVFWCIIEQLYEQGGFLSLKSCKSIAFALHVDSKVVESIVRDFGLFQHDEKNFWADSVNRRLDKQRSIAESRRRSAAKRWEIAKVEQEQCNTNANALQKISEEKASDVPKTDDKKVKTVFRFRPPTLEEVQSFIQEKGYRIDAESFIAFYESKGWMVGSSKMKNWRMAIVTWSKRKNGYQEPRASVMKKCNDEWI